MNINIHDRNTLNAFVSKVAPHIKPGANALKTAIAHAYDYPHITALESALAHDVTSDSTPSAATIHSHLDDLRLWLIDNVDMGTNIHFDNEGDTTSTEVLEALESLMAQVTPLDMAAVTQRQQAFDTFDSKDSVLTNAELTDVSELDVGHWEDAEDALVLDAKALASSPQLAHALTLLEQHGLTDIAGHIGSVAINSKDIEFLKTVV